MTSEINTALPNAEGEGNPLSLLPSLLKEQEAINTMLLKETWVNKSEGYNFGESDFYEPFTTNLKDLFNSLMREHGRCISSMFIDKKSGGTAKIGWVFEKLKVYEDTGEKYLQETWVEVHEKEPTRTIQNHYYPFDNKILEA